MTPRDERCAPAMTPQDKGNCESYFREGFMYRGSRFHAGRRLDDKEEATLLYGLFMIWIATQGAPKRLYFDGEGGLNTERVKSAPREKAARQNRERRDNTRGTLTDCQRRYESACT